jgi:signal peptidase I
MSNPEDRTEPEDVADDVARDLESDAETMELDAEHDELAAEEATPSEVGEATPAEEAIVPADEPANMEPIGEAEAVPSSASATGQPETAPPEPIVPANDAAMTPPRRPRRAKSEGDSWYELIKTVFYAVLIAVFVRTVLFQPFNIPSGSMQNTLLIGDYLFISKFSYGYSLYSLPWGYWIRRHVDMPGRILGSEPERGDIVVFKYPPDNKTDYIKRLIGLPGDRIQMVDGILYINGNPVPREYAGEDVAVSEGGVPVPVKRYRETLPNGVTYITLDVGNTEADNTGVYIVPAGHYFMMGDNRDNSRDSRADVGFVPNENLIGRARIIWWSVDHTIRLFDPTTWISAIRYDRIATVVD